MAKRTRKNKKNQTTTSPSKKRSARVKPSVAKKAPEIPAKELAILREEFEANRAINLPSSICSRGRLYRAVVDHYRHAIQLPMKLEELRPEHMIKPKRYKGVAGQLGTKFGPMKGRDAIQFWAGAVAVAFDFDDLDEVMCFAATPEQSKVLQDALDQVRQHGKEMTAYLAKHGRLEDEHFHRHDRLEAKAKALYRKLKPDPRNLLAQTMIRFEVGLVAFSRVDYMHHIFGFDPDSAPRTRVLAYRKGHFKGEEIEIWSRWSNDAQISMQGEAAQRRFQLVRRLMKKVIFSYSATKNQNGNKVQVTTSHIGLFTETEETVDTPGFGKNRGGTYAVWELDKKYTSTFQVTANPDTHLRAAFFTVPLDIFNLPKSALALGLSIYLHDAYSKEKSVIAFQRMLKDSGAIRSTDQSVYQTAENFAKAVRHCKDILGIGFTLDDTELHDAVEFHNLLEASPEDDPEPNPHEPDHPDPAQDSTRPVKAKQKSSKASRKAHIDFARRPRSSRPLSKDALSWLRTHVRRNYSGAFDVIC